MPHADGTDHLLVDVIQKTTPHRFDSGFACKTHAHAQADMTTNGWNTVMGGTTTTGLDKYRNCLEKRLHVICLQTHTQKLTR